MSRKNPKSKYHRTKTKSHHDLQPLQDKFCYEYLKDRNATQAAIRAGYSKKTADSIGPKLLQHACVQYKINRLIEEQNARIELTADLVLKEIIKLATFDIQDIFDTNGNLKDVADMPENVRKAVASIEVFEEFGGQGKLKKSIGFTKKIKFWPKDRSLEMLARHLKLLGDVKVLPSGTIIFQDIKIEQSEAPQLLTDINNRLALQFSKQ